MLFESGELQLCRLFELSELFELARGLASLSALFLVGIVSLIEIIQSFISDLLTIIANTELIRPSSDSACRLLQFLDEAHVHLSHLTMDINDSA